MHDRSVARPIDLLHDRSVARPIDQRRMVATCASPHGSAGGGVHNSRAVPVRAVDDLSVAEFQREFSNTAESTGLRMAH